MLLRIAEPGHPMRCGFGKSRDKPLFSRSSIRFSSPLNSSCSFRTRLLSLEVATKNGQVYRDRSMQVTPARIQTVTSCGQSGFATCQWRNGIEVWPVAPLASDVTQFLSTNIRTAEQ